MPDEERHLATIGRLTAWLDHALPKPLPDGELVKEPCIRLVTQSKYGTRLSLEQSVDLARLLIKTAAANGWGSDEERERLIAWAPVKHA